MQQFRQPERSRQRQPEQQYQLQLNTCPTCGGALNDKLTPEAIERTGEKACRCRRA